MAPALILFSFTIAMPLFIFKDLCALLFFNLKVCRCPYHYQGEICLQAVSGIKIITQNIDTSTPEGRLFFHMNAAFDQFQRELIVENTRVGLQNARRHGRVGGRPKTMTDQMLRASRAMLKDTENYRFVSDVIRALKIGRTTFYSHFPPEKIEEIREASGPL